MHSQANAVVPRVKQTGKRAVPNNSNMIRVGEPLPYWRRANPTPLRGGGDGRVVYKQCHEGV